MAAGIKGTISLFVVMFNMAPAVTGSVRAAETVSVVEMFIHMLLMCWGRQS